MTIRKHAAALFVIQIAVLAAAAFLVYLVALFHPLPPPPSFVQPYPPPLIYQFGIASWYGVPEHGRRTASGERYDMHQLTAAHPYLPFGTILRVTNQKNGRSVLVRVNDRLPKIWIRHRRVIDMSRAAGEELGMIRDGLVPVEIALVLD